MNRFTMFFGSLVLTAVLTVVPAAASARGIGGNANAQTHVSINENGIVNVIGAEVTSVSGAVINAATTLSNIVINWVVNISSTTKVSADDQTTASTTAAINVGDKINFTGTLSNIGSTMTVAATKVRDLAGVVALHFKSFIVSSVNAANDSFTANAGKHTLTVQGNASTTVTINGATSTIASLQSGDKVKVAGTPNADGSIITATSVVVGSTANNDKDSDDTGNKAGLVGSTNTSDGIHLDVIGQGNK